MSFVSEPVTVVRELRGEVTRVFEAWSNPDYLKVWFGGGNNRVVDADVDFREGGAYRIKLADPESEMVVSGTYTRIEKPYILEFTWQWEESSIEKGVSLVRIDLEDNGPNTGLTLTHTKLASAKSEEAHQHGWNAVLDRLDRFIEGTIS